MSHVTVRILFVFSCVTWDLFTNFMKFHMISGYGPWKQSNELGYRTEKRTLYRDDDKLLAASGRILIFPAHQATLCPL